MKRHHNQREVHALAAAVRWAQDHGWTKKELPQGRRGSCDLCPLAEATGCIIAGHIYLDPFSDSWNWHDLPKTVRDFVDLFDRGRFPELER